MRLKAEVDGLTYEAGSLKNFAELYLRRAADERAKASQASTKERRYHEGKASAYEEFAEMLDAVVVEP